jgi:hypothetical protein
MSCAKPSHLRDYVKRIFVLLVLVSTPLANCQSLEPFDQMPEFSLRGVDGKIYTKEFFKDKDLLAVVFLSNHCRVSQIFQKTLIKLTNTFQEKKIGIMAISPNYEEAILPDELAYSDLGDSFVEMQKRAFRMKYNFIYLFDGDKQVFTQKVGVKITPTVYIFNKKRQLIYIGRIGNHETPEKIETSDLYKTLMSNLNNDEGKFKRTKVFGTSIKYIDDLVLAEQVRMRYANETIKIVSTDDRKLKFYINHLTGKPKLFYVWKVTDKEPRENLITISGLYKIFRKRGLKVITVCVAEENTKEKALDLLKQAQLSSTNFVVSGKNISPLTTIMPNDIKRITPFYRLLSSDGKMQESGNGKIVKDNLRVQVLNSLNEE